MNLITHIAPNTEVATIDVATLGVARASGTLEVSMDGLSRAVVAGKNMKLNGVSYYSAHNVALLIGGEWVVQYNGRALYRQDFVDSSSAANEKWRDLVAAALVGLQADPEFSRFIMRAHKRDREREVARVQQDIEQVTRDLAAFRDHLELLELEVASCTELTPDQLQHARAFMAAGHPFVDAINAALVVVPS